MPRKVNLSRMSSSAIPSGGQTVLTFTSTGIDRVALAPFSPPPKVPAVSFVAETPSPTRNAYPPTSPNVPAVSFVAETPSPTRNAYPPTPPKKVAPTSQGIPGGSAFYVKTAPIVASDPEDNEEDDEFVPESVPESPKSPVFHLAPRVLFSEIAAPKGKPKSKKHRKYTKGSEYNYRRGIWKLNNQINHTHSHSVSCKAMTVLNDFVVGKMTAICEAAEVLCKKTGKATLSSREIQTAVRLIIPGYGKPNSLCDHAVAEGTKSVTRWYCNPSRM